MHMCPLWGGFLGLGDEPLLGHITLLIDLTRGIELDR